MMRTRLQARLMQAGTAGESSAYSTDSEVSFGSTWLDAAFLGQRPLSDPRTDPESDSTSHDMADDRQERRMQLLESAVMGMTEKFDELLTNFNCRSDQARDKQRRPHQAAPVDPPAGVRIRGRRYEEARPPHMDYRAPQFSEYVAEELQREEFAVPRHDEGKSLASSMYIKTLIRKPYMYLSRPGLVSLNKKLDARETMTFHEYIVAFIKMIRDPKAELAGLNDFLLEHLQQVTEDAATRDWPSVRRWSQTTFDAVENGTTEWQDRAGMQVERLRHAILAVRPSNVAHTQAVDRRDIPCKDFNSPHGCSNMQSHAGRNVNFAHVCSLCFSAGGRLPHPAHTCPRRQPKHQCTSILPLRQKTGWRPHNRLRGR